MSTLVVSCTLIDPLLLDLLSARARVQRRASSPLRALAPQSRLTWTRSLSRSQAGIETTATFDVQSDEFVIHTPHLYATKWWIGGAASTATHCAVFAQLVIDGKKHGVKTFVVQLRDTKCVPSLPCSLPSPAAGGASTDRAPGRRRTFMLMPGVNIGDIGKKMGRDGIDNGYIQFTYVRVPRSHVRPAPLLFALPLLACRARSPCADLTTLTLAPADAHEAHPVRRASLVLALDPRDADPASLLPPQGFAQGRGVRAAARAAHLRRRA